MIPVTQTKVIVRNSKDELIVRGNCFAAVVASILELPITEVPNVEVLFFLKEKNKHYWSEVMNVFLEELGYELNHDYRFAVYHDNSFGESENSIWTKEHALEYCKDKMYLASGLSARGVNHVCIYKNGELIHDPHPSREGLLTLTNFQTLEKKENGNKMLPVGENQ